MKLVLLASVTAIMMVSSALGQTVTVVNGHPTDRIVRIEAIDDSSGELLEASLDVVLEPGDEDDVYVVGTGEDCECTLFATFADGTTIQARGVDVCADPIWTILDGDYQID